MRSGANFKHLQKSVWIASKDPGNLYVRALHTGCVWVRSGLLSHDQTPVMPSRSVVETLSEVTMSFCYRCLEEVCGSMA